MVLDRSLQGLAGGRGGRAHVGPRPPPDFCSHRVTLTQLRRSAERVRVEGELGLVDSDRLAGVCEPAPSPGRPFRRPSRLCPPRAPSQCRTSWWSAPARPVAAGPRLCSAHLGSAWLQNALRFQGARRSAWSVSPDCAQASQIHSTPEYRGSLCPRPSSEQPGSKAPPRPAVARPCPSRARPPSQPEPSPSPCGARPPLPTEPGPRPARSPDPSPWLTRSSSKLIRPSSSVSRSSGSSATSARSSVGGGRGRNRLSRRHSGDCRPEGGSVSCCSRLSLCFLAKFTNTWWAGAGAGGGRGAGPAGRATPAQGTHVVQGGLADRVVLDAQHAHHLFHFAEHLRQRDVLGLELVLHLRVVPLLGGTEVRGRSGGAPFPPPLRPCPP